MVRIATPRQVAPSFGRMLETLEANLATRKAPMRRRRGMPRRPATSRPCVHTLDPQVRLPYDVRSDCCRSHDGLGDAILAGDRADVIAWYGAVSKVFASGAGE
ncbi:hypothetical protein OI25_605 [Paraburkholderia fungorum]|uniref:Uncharacterized protein n=1 Tax=Paraburkholderia fungorum TaxID=134537 RepID=A0AAU8T6B0_9BURK|nr:hypothetical protein OI25_605 [Paraburkholderia fungorum]